jgi:hypothetical protein
MKRRLHGRSVHELNRDYVDLTARAEEYRLPEELAAKLEAYRRFIERQGHRIARQPGALLALAHAESQDSVVRATAGVGGRLLRLRAPAASAEELSMLGLPPEVTAEPALLLFRRSVLRAAQQTPEEAESLWEFN